MVLQRKKINLIVNLVDKINLKGKMGSDFF
jgi:hypothetical protein